MLHTHEVTGSSPVVSTSQKTPPCWVVFFDSRKVWDLNPLQCDMPVAYHNSQFKNWLSPYEFALRQIQQSSPLVSTKKLLETDRFLGVFLCFPDLSPFMSKLNVLPELFGKVLAFVRFDDYNYAVIL